MNVIANLAIKPNSPSSFPTQMEIDHIRVYQKINSTKSIEICSNDDIKGSTVAGQEIIVSGENCSVHLESDAYIDLVAKDKIVLNSGFSVATGAHFSAKTIGSSGLKSTKISYSSDEKENIAFQSSIDIVPSIGQVRIFPNPSTSHITITSTTLQKYHKVNIFDLKGQLIYIVNIDEDSSQEIDVSILEKGLYVIKIVSPLHTHIDKLIIQ